jgi:hypothetical protein
MKFVTERRSAAAARLIISYSLGGMISVNLDAGSSPVPLCLPFLILSAALSALVPGNK